MGFTLSNILFDLWSVKLPYPSTKVLINKIFISYMYNPLINAVVIKYGNMISLYLIKQGCKTFDSVLKMLKNIQTYIKLMVTYVTYMQIIGIDFSFPCTTVILFSIGLTTCKLLTANYIELNK